MSLTPDLQKQAESIIKDFAKNPPLEYGPLMATAKCVYCGLYGPSNKFKHKSTCLYLRSVDFVKTLRKQEQTDRATVD